MRPEVTLAYATFPDRAIAEDVCRRLVSEKIVACANILAPHASIYRWEGRLTESVEVAAILKLASTQRETLAQRFRELHPFDVPALLYVDVTGGSTPFLEWIASSSAPG